MKQLNKSESKVKKRKKSIALIICIALLVVTIGGNIPSMASDVDTPENENSSTTSAIINPDEELEKKDEAAENNEKEKVKPLAQNGLSTKGDMSAKDSSDLEARFVKKLNTKGDGVIITGFLTEGYTEETLVIPSTIEGYPVTELNADSMTSISNLSGLKEVTVPEGVTAIGHRAFQGTYVEKVNLPDSLTTLGTAVFKSSGIKSIDMSGTQVKTIDMETFSQAKQLADVKLPAKLEKIAASAFTLCSKLTSIDFPSSLKSMDGNYTFSSTPLTSLDLSNTKVTKIGNYSFQYAKLQEVKLNEGLQEIGTYAFRDGISKYVNVTVKIPSTVTKIAANSFNGMSSGVIDVSDFDSGEIPLSPWGAANSTQIKWKVDNNCFWIDKNGYIVGLKDLGHTTDAGECTNTDYHGSNLDITFPKNYIGADGSEKPVAGIAENAFNGNKNIKSIKFEEGSNYTEIKDSTFLGCTALTSVELPEGLNSIGEYAFEQTTRLESIDIPDSVKTIGKRAFYGSQIKSISLSENVTKIEPYTFAECNALEEITIPAKVTEITTNAISTTQNNKLATVTINGSDQIQIEKDAFKGRNKMTLLDMSDKLKSSVSDIKNEPWGANYATIKYRGHEEPQYILYKTDEKAGVTWGFHRGTGTIVEFKAANGDAFTKDAPYTAKELVVPSSFEVGGETYNVNTLGTSLFSYKLNVEHLILSEGITTVNNSAARDCPAIEKLTLPATLTTVDTDGFFKSGIKSIVFNESPDSKPLSFALRAFGSNKLKTLDLPANLSRISTDAFKNNELEGRINIGSNVQSIANTSFEGNDGINVIYIDNFYKEAGIYITGSGKFGALNATVIYKGSVPTVTTNAIDKDDRGRNITLEVKYGDPDMNVKSIKGVNPVKDITKGFTSHTTKTKDYYVYENGTYEFTITNAINNTVTHQAIIDDIGKMNINANDVNVNILDVDSMTVDQLLAKAKASAKDLDSGSTKAGITYEISSDDIYKVNSLKDEGKKVEVTITANYTGKYPDGAVGVGNVDLSGKTYTNTISTTIEVTLVKAIFNVDFDLNGGKGDIPASQTVEYKAQKVNKPTESITYKGYIFDGWYKDKVKAGEALDPNNKWNFATDDVTSNTTLYAGWKSYSYTVNFDVNAENVDAVNSLTVKSPDTTLKELPKDPSRIGYTFDGWNMEKDGNGEKFSDYTEVTGDVTVYAKWGIKYYQLVFNLNGASGTAPETQSRAFETTAAAVEAPVWSGNKFLGWNTKADGTGTTWNFEESTMPAEDVVLYAQWEKDNAVAGEEANNDNNGDVLNQDANPKEDGNDEDDQKVLGKEAKTSDSMSSMLILIVLGMIALIAIIAVVRLKRKEQ